MQFFSRFLYDSTFRFDTLAKFTSYYSWIKETYYSISKIFVTWKIAIRLLGGEGKKNKTFLNCVTNFKKLLRYWLLNLIFFNINKTVTYHRSVINLKNLKFSKGKMVTLPPGIHKNWWTKSLNLFLLCRKPIIT